MALPKKKDVIKLIFTFFCVAGSFLPTLSPAAMAMILANTLAMDVLTKALDREEVSRWFMRISTTAYEYWAWIEYMMTRKV